MQCSAGMPKFHMVQGFLGGGGEEEGARKDLSHFQSTHTICTQ